MIGKRLKRLLPDFYVADFLDVFLKLVYACINGFAKAE
jgi:hypothetical protein